MAAAPADALSASQASALLQSIPWSQELRTLAARFGELTAATDGHAHLSYAALCARAHVLVARRQGDIQLRSEEMS